MTKRHFIDLADRLRHLDVPDDVLEELCDFMKAWNPRFDKERWLAYYRGECGPGGGKLKPKPKPKLKLTRQQKADKTLTDFSFNKPSIC